MSDAVRLDARLEARDEVSGYRRIELISGRRQRRAWPDNEKARIIAESAELGANISDVAHRNGVNRGLLATWRRAAGVVRARGMPPSFIPVEVEAAPREPMAPCGIDVDLRAGRVSLRGGVEPALAAAVIGRCGEAHDLPRSCAADLAVARARRFPSRRERACRAGCAGASGGPLQWRRLHFPVEAERPFEAFDVGRHGRGFGHEVG
ncbi:MAG: hypothetical protein E5V60_01325 [Mesorhizobium sp.]|nr:MAG: hypothetical protein EOR08_29985 [Mesorhizobium sp.]TIW69286.1 MAG: hypothetical protein E5V60_01325 [Mesorhizobium sp.]